MPTFRPRDRHGRFIPSWVALRRALVGPELVGEGRLLVDRWRRLWGDWRVILAVWLLVAGALVAALRLTA